MVTPEQFDAAFDSFRHTAFRLETRQTYAVSEEDARLRAFREGLPRPERSICTDPWLRRIAQTTLAGKSWTRVRLVSHPLTEYTRYQLVGYRESAAVGEQISMIDLEVMPELASLGPDFWLFDVGEPGEFMIETSYSDNGRVCGYSYGSVQTGRAQRNIALANAIPLALFLSRLGIR